MKTHTKAPADYNYDEVVGLACQIWQEEGCRFGHYQACWQQAKNHFLAARRGEVPRLHGGKKPECSFSAFC